MKADVPSKCKEFSFLVMNRQVWTAWKQSETARHRGEEESDRCVLCEERETTFHILYECETYSYRMWNEFEQIVNKILERGGEGQSIRLRIGAFQVMYGQKIIGLGKDHKWEKAILRSIMQIKSWIYQKRTLRMTGNRTNVVRFTRQRILGHLYIIQNRRISLLQFQGKNCECHTLLRDLLLEEV